ncbi:MAG: tetratricopeptide repeat protein [Nodosilinea sp.]
MTANPQDLTKAAYALGQNAFERGNYREAVDHFEQAASLAKLATPLGGEIQTWLVNAYSAVGRQGEAIALCETLSRHPDLEVCKQAKNLLYILQAPQLKRPSNWMSEIPDLAAISADSPLSSGPVVKGSSPRSALRPRPQTDPVPPDPSQINSKDNGFLWAALGAVILIFAGLLWLS